MFKAAMYPKWKLALTLSVRNIPEIVSVEIAEQLPFLATTKILMAAVKAGAGRESAHEALKELSTKALIAKREGNSYSLMASIAEDPRIPLDLATLEKLISNPSEFIGDATSQTERVIVRIEAAIKPFPGALGYTPGAIR